MGKTLNVQDLSVHPKNPRKISDKRLEQLSRSMSEYGDISGIVFNRRSGNLVGGNQRSKKLDATSKVVITKRLEKTSRVGTVATGYILHQGERFSYREVDWDITKETGAMLAANNNAGTWDDAELKNHLKQLSSFDVDFDLDLTMFEDTELQEMGIKDIVVSEHLRSGPTGVDEDDVPESSVPRSKLGDLYLLGSHRLLCGDSTDVESVSRLMNGEKADMVFTSPPYNLGISAKLSGNSKISRKGNVYESHDDKMSETDYADFLWRFSEIGLAVGRYSFINIQTLAGNRKSLWDWLYRSRDSYVDTLIWDKQHAQPAAAARVVNSRFEFVFIHSKEEPVNRAIRIAPNFRGTVDNVYSSPPQRSNEFSEVHGATFPVSFPENYISTFTPNGAGVYEPFCGSGSTLIACEKTGRKCYGMEIDQHYCDIIVERWEKYTGMKAKLLGSTVKTKKAAKSVV